MFQSKSMTWLDLTAEREAKWVDFSAWAFWFTLGGPLAGLEHTLSYIIFLNMFGEAVT